MGPIRSEQMCSRCRNHGESSILKGHKRNCKFLFCTCKKCNDTKTRQKCIASEIAIHRRHVKATNGSSEQTNHLKFACERFVDAGEHRRSQMCARCKNHGIDQPLRGHKNDCQFANCQCEICEITAERRKIMAKQIREYRQTRTTDGTESQTRNLNEDYTSDEEELPQMTPMTSLHTPRFLDRFYLVQSLYDKFLQQDSVKQIQLLYAMVILSRENVGVMENALREALPYATEYTIHHQNFPPRSFLEYFLPPSPSSILETNAASTQTLKNHVRVRDMRDLIGNGTNSSSIISRETNFEQN